MKPTKKFKLWILKYHEDKIEDLVFSNNHRKEAILRELRREYDDDKINLSKKQKGR